MEKSKLRSILSFTESLSFFSHTLTKADLLPLPNSSLSSTYDALSLYYTQTNLKENVTSSHCKQFLLPISSHLPKNSDDSPILLSQFSLSDAFPYVSHSPMRNFKAVLQSFADLTDKSKKRNTLEIYNKDHLEKSLNLDEFHGSVLNNSMVGSPLVWSQNEEKLLYLAELKPEKKLGFFDNYHSLDDKDLEKAQKCYLYESDYGEKLNNVTRIAIFVYDVVKGILQQMIMPYSTLFPTNPDFADFEGKSLIFCGFLSDPVKLGILHCINRPAKVFFEEIPRFKQVFPRVKAKNEENEQNLEEDRREIKEMCVLIDTYDTCIRPLLSPDRKKLAYFGSPLKPPHLNTLALHIYDMSSKKDECVVPIVQENVFLSRKPEEINKNMESFSGIAGFYDVLDKIYWLSDSKHLVFQSISGFQSGVFLVNSETKELVQLSLNNVSPLNMCKLTILGKDPIKDVIIASFETMKNGGFPECFALRNLAQLLKNGSNAPLKEIPQNCEWTKLIKTPELKNKSPLERRISEVFAQKFRETSLKAGDCHAVLWDLEDYSRGCEDFHAIFGENSLQNPSEKKPLVVNVHGGPHGNCCGFSAVRTTMLLRGYKVLLPNFTGSCGFGQKHIENLMKNIGQRDVDEIIALIKQCIEFHGCDAEKIIVIGGSYGGYLSGIIATRPQFSRFFKAAILLNPVVNIPFLLGSSDIPEWGPAVSCGKRNWWQLQGDELEIMFKQSPVSGDCAIPCLILLGAKDRRVPYQGALAFYKKMLMEGAKNLEVFVYPESDHALAENVQVEADVSVKILGFLAKFLEE